MSDATVTAAGEPSIVLDPAAPKPSPTAPIGEPAQALEEKHTWLPGRLAQATESGFKKGLAAAEPEVLKSLGFSSVEEAKKAGEEAAAAREAKKSAAQKAAEAEAAAKALNGQLEESRKALSSYAESEMKKLSDAQRKAVTDVAGDDPALQLKAITALGPTWAGAAGAQATPKDTAPAPNAPKDGGNAPAPDLMAIYREWAPKNPVWAARFAEANRLFDDWTK